MSIEVKSISKTYGKFQALTDINLEIATGELVALLGPSGSGKTTLLRMIAGLEDTEVGRINFHGEDTTNQPVGKRQVGFVFQHYALFRHLTIFDNIAFGLQVKNRKERPSREFIRKRVTELLQLVQLEGLGNRYPTQLSGGQRQRVALARALAVEPKVLLLDEPFGALDAKVRQELRRWLRQLHDKLHITTVFVTHDQEEALEMADRVVIMNQGKIEQVGSPEEIYHYPANPFVYSFLGRVNRFNGESFKPTSDTGSAAIGYVRPHEIDLSRIPVSKNSFEATIQHIYPIGPTIRLECKRVDSEVLFEVEISHERYKELGLKIHDKVYATIKNLRMFQATNQVTTVIAEQTNIPFYTANAHS
ncbi:sulfate/molybdate ABC transporter ATP-binding protein [Brevibacillus ginsengisoli]|uniref:sulfate/molybdate ABC transporter ATP-binding protein n=1 Tax=Brevibacillus ginsengisoli TaxID=363854 RepID=UPI003CEF60BA